MKRILAAAIACMALASCGPAFKPKESGTYAVIKTSKGEIAFKLLPETAPKTVENFVGLATGKKEWSVDEPAADSSGDSAADVAADSTDSAADPAAGTDAKPAAESKAKNKKKAPKPFYDGLVFHRVVKDFMIQGGDPKGDGTGGPGYTFEDETYRSTDEEITGKVDDEEKAVMVWSKIVVPYVLNNMGQGLDPAIEKIIQTVMQNGNGEALYGMTVDQYRKLTGSTERLFKQEVIHPVAYGNLCMANAGPDTNGSQFFIVTAKDGCPWLDGNHTVFGEAVKGMEIAHEIEGVPVDDQDKPTKPVVIKKIWIIEKK